MQSNSVSFEGTIDGVIFHNKENGFTVFTFEQTAKGMPRGEIITATGYLLDPMEGETMGLEGSYVVNPKYGRQLAVSKSWRVEPESMSAIEKYLGSGVISGIGAATAKRIVAKFKEDTFDIIENHPERLAELKGISVGKALQYGERFHATRQQRGTMLFLQEYGLSPKMCMRVYKQYKEEAVEIVKVNPYRLVLFFLSGSQYIGVG